MKEKDFKLRIGHLTYTVKIISKEIMEAKSLYGQCNTNKQEINLVEGMTKERFKEVLIHECLHAMYDSENIYASTEEECVVNGLGTGISKLFRDNKKIRDLYCGK